MDEVNSGNSEQNML